MMNGTMRDTHRQLDKARLVIWSMVNEAHTEGRKKDRDTLMDAYDLIITEMIKIEFSDDWQESMREALHGSEENGSL